MKKKLIMCVLSSCCMLVFGIGNINQAMAGNCNYSSGGNDHKITICHIPPGHPENRHAITIDRSALAAHLEHGDFEEPCDFDYYGNSDHKVTICHIPPGNPSNNFTITVDENALAAHLAHGDYEGVCGDGVGSSGGGSSGGGSPSITVKSWQEAVCNH